MEIAMYLAQSKVAAGQLGEAVSYYNKVIAMGVTQQIYIQLQVYIRHQAAFLRLDNMQKRHFLAKPGGKASHIDW